MQGNACRVWTLYRSRAIHRTTVFCSHSHQQRASLSSTFTWLRVLCKKDLTLFVHDKDWFCEWIKYCCDSAPFSFRIVAWRRKFPLEAAVGRRCKFSTTIMVSKTTGCEQGSGRCSCCGRSNRSSSSSSSYLNRWMLLIVEVSVRQPGGIGFIVVLVLFLLEWKVVVECCSCAVFNHKMITCCVFISQHQSILSTRTVFEAVPVTVVGEVFFCSQ